MKILSVFVLLLNTISSSAQITGKWRYEENHTEFVLEIEEKNGKFFGNIIEAKTKGKDTSMKYAGLFITDFVKVSPTDFKGYYTLNNKKKYKGTIVQTDQNTLEFHYRWLLFSFKDIWKRIEKMNLKKEK